MSDERVHEEREGQDTGSDGAGQAAGDAQSGGGPSGGERVGGERRDLSWHLERIWTELKDVTRQLESETRRGGRIAKLHFDMRGLKQEFETEAARLGRLVYEAQMEGGKRPTLSRVDGYDETVERIAALQGRIEALEEEIAELRRDSENVVDL